MNSKIALLKRLELEIKAVETLTKGKQWITGAYTEQKVDEAVERHRKTIMHLEKSLGNDAA
jgi:TATA-box binding protein (TBP) (component of TFIID and TFIIIB)